MKCLSIKMTDAELEDCVKEAGTSLQPPDHPWPPTGLPALLPQHTQDAHTRTPGPVHPPACLQSPQLLIAHTARTQRVSMLPHMYAHALTLRGLDLGGKMDYVEFCELMTRRMRDVNEEEEVGFPVCSVAPSQT